MICPSCSYILQKFSVTTNEGGRFYVDHCGRCGGTWFDPYEINRIPFHEVVRLAKETVLAQNQRKFKGSNLCPRCHKKLTRLEGESMPKGVILTQCGICHGIWASQKALEEFKKHQNQTVEEYKVRKRAFPALSMIFVPILTILLLLLSTFATFISTQEAKENRIRASYLIENLSVSQIVPATVTVSFQTKMAVTSQITYGISSFEMKTEIISEKPTAIHAVVLRNLETSSIYIYTITLTDVAGRSFITSEKSFSTR